MSLNNSQAIAVNVVLSFLGIGDGLLDRAPIDPEVLQAALSNLADSAHKQLNAGPTSTHVEAGMSKVLGRAAGQDSDGLAQAVCRGIDSHIAHQLLACVKTLSYCAFMTQTPTIVATVAQQVRAAREARGWSGRQLAERCAELGADNLNRSIIANIENGRRRSIGVDELLVLALALNVAPIALLLPPSGEVTVTGRLDPIGTDDLRAWVEGRRPLIGGDGDGPDSALYWSWRSDQQRRIDQAEGVGHLVRLTATYAEQRADEDHEGAVSTLLRIAERVRSQRQDIGTGPTVAEAHNGSLPWPSIRRPFDEWKAAHEKATA